MHRDPHDALLLTRRPTTVITQATALLDSMPGPYGSQEDEDSIFAGVLGEGETDGVRQAASDAAKARLASLVPGIAPGSDAPAATAVAPSIWHDKRLWAVGAAIGLFLLLRK